MSARRWQGEGGRGGKISGSEGRRRLQKWRLKMGKVLKGKEEDAEHKRNGGKKETTEEGNE